MKTLSIFIILLYILGIIGEIKCIYKTINCNWKPIRKAEIIYTATACCGLNAITGYINIKNE